MTVIMTATVRDLDVYNMDDNNLCTLCSKTPTRPGKQTCQKCYDNFNTVKVSPYSTSPSNKLIQERGLIRSSAIGDCIVCGTSITGRHHSAKYCSEDCRNKRYEHICETCGKTFYRTRMYARFCSHSCCNRNAASRKKRIIGPLEMIE